MKYRHLAAALIASSASLYNQSALSAPEIRIVALFEDQAMLSLDNGSPFIAATGEEISLGVKLVSADSTGAVFNIDGETLRYGLDNSISNMSGKSVARESVHIGADAQGMFLASGNINDKDVRFIVDTGATFVSMGRNTALRLGIDYMRDGQAAWSSTANGQMRSYRVKLRKVQIGGITLYNVDGSVGMNNMDVVLLGMSFLRRLEVIHGSKSLELREK